MAASKPGAWLAAVALAATLAVSAGAVAGCGGDGEEPVEAGVNRIGEAEFAVVDRAVREGRLGTREEVLASMRDAAERAQIPDADGNVGNTQFFDDDGDLLPINEMDAYQLDGYFTWEKTPFVRDTLYEEMRSAGRDALNESGGD